MLVAIAVIGLLVALLLPAVQAAREGARRTQCVHNLRQLAIAAQNYHDTIGCLPMGGYYPRSSLVNANSGPYTFALLPYLDRQSLYDSINFDIAPFFAANVTIHGIGVSTFWCPSDPLADASVRFSNVLYDDLRRPVSMRYNSYAANCGLWFLMPNPDDPTRERQLAEMNGVMYENSAVRMGDITDGTATTILLGEQAQSIGSRRRWRWWTSSIGTQMTAMWPPNPQRVALDSEYPSIPSGGSIYLVSASSSHSGGANFAFADGSVHFIKETIDSWRLDRVTGMPAGVIYSPVTRLFLLGRGARPGVYQALSTRNRGEVISSEF